MTWRSGESGFLLHGAPFGEIDLLDRFGNRRRARRSGSGAGLHGQPLQVLDVIPHVLQNDASAAGAPRTRVRSMPNSRASLRMEGAAAGPAAERSPSVCSTVGTGSGC